MLYGTTDPHATGLLLRNYRPRLFMLSRLTDCRATKMPRGRRRLTTQRGTTGHREYDMQVVVRGSGGGLRLGVHRLDESTQLLSPSSHED